jgi:serine/threonine protein kinase
VNAGDVSVKLDIFSFGVILLELLTGLAPFDANREHVDLLAHVTELLFDASDDENDSDDAANNDDDDDKETKMQTIRQDNRIERTNRLLDSNVGPWNIDCARSLFDLAHETTHERKRKRPSMEQVIERLSTLPL